jgi:hypothetical protein
VNNDQIVRFVDNDALVPFIWCKTVGVFGFSNNSIFKKKLKF